MWFGLLGSLCVRDGDAVMPVVAAKQRAVLAALLLRVDQAVPVDELAEIVWDGSPPATAPTTIRNYVKRLRHLLGPTGRSLIVTCASGYRLQADDDDVDVRVFTRLCRDGDAAARSGDWPRAYEALNEALELWRGPPLADIPSETLRQEHVPPLETLHLEAVERRADAGLALGRHAEFTHDLQVLCEAHPLRERFWTQRMLALYRCGRQSDALTAYQQARRTLLDELGVEPGPELREMHRRILDADPALELAAPGPSDRPVPRQLPAAAPHFVGRGEELAELTKLMEDRDGQAAGTAAITAIGGTAGVGKTTLALYWARQVADRFPDGQLYVNLRGSAPSGTPMSRKRAIWGFLDALGVAPERVPPTPAAMVGLYRSLLADRRMLIVLDNARDEAQVRPLLPASPGSLVLVTSRSQLCGLAASDGARLLTLDVLPHEEATQFLVDRLGADRAAAEPDAVSEIAALCSHLPLALAVAAARAATEPGFPLSALAAALRDARGRLDVLDAGDPGTSVRAVFSWSYCQLSPDAARLFRLLGLHPGPDISVPAAASLAAATVPETARMLRELLRAHLLDEHALGRGAFHDLLRAYAADQARVTDSETDRREAVGRVLDHYLHTASRAALLLRPSHEQIAYAPPRPGTAPEQPVDHRQALTWFEAEYPVLIAAVALASEYGFDTHAWKLPWAMAPFLHARVHYQEWAATQRTALAAATRIGDAAGQAVASRLLGGACAWLGDYDQALEHLTSSLKLDRRLGNRFGQAAAHEKLGLLAECEGRYAAAVSHAEQALYLYQAIGHKVGEAGVLNNAGWDRAHLGDYRQARELCRRSLELLAEVGDRRIEGHAWGSLGYAEYHLGNLGEAAACYQRALGIIREFGELTDEATVLTRLGDTRHTLGDLSQAREAWRQALMIFHDIQHPDADKIRAKLDGLNG